jgi:hypothetical protein
MFWLAQAEEAKRYFSHAQEVFRVVKVGFFGRFHLKVLIGRRSPFLPQRIVDEEAI